MAASRPGEHPDARLFLRAICEDPRDDTPRLVFADWLEENGHDAQAAYIRLAITGKDLRGRERRRWERRCDQLLDPAWLWPLLDLCSARVRGRQHGFDMDRGFAWSLTLPPGAFVENAADIFRFQPITQVVLSVGLIGFSTAIGQTFGGTLYDADLTARGERTERVPGPIFPFLDKVGVPCTIRGARAEFAERLDRRTGPVILSRPAGPVIVSRAAVAFGRDLAGLSPLTWGPLE